MSIQELCVDVYALATSSTPAVDIIVVAVSNGSGTSTTAGSGPAPSVLVSTASAVSTVDIDHYALMLSTGAATSTATPDVVMDALLESKAKAKSTLFAVFNHNDFSSASATSSIVAMDVPMLLVSSGVAISTPLFDIYREIELTSSARAESEAIFGLLESLVSSASAESYVFPYRVTFGTEISNGAGTSEVFLTNFPQCLPLVSAGVAVSAVEMQVAMQAAMVSQAEAASTVFIMGTAGAAWLMNTETTAVSWFENFGFDSLVQTPSKRVAVGPEGIYVFGAGLDAGAEIDATVDSGYTDFGMQQTKRVDNMYYGLTGGGVDLVVTTLESNLTKVYPLEARAASRPGATRVTPGKGMAGRYWRIILRNQGGNMFEFFDATVDLAVSPRRI